MRHPERGSPRRVSRPRRRPVGRSAAALSWRRRGLGWLLAVCGPPGLTLVLASTREVYGPPTELMLFLAFAVVVALVGGLWPAVAAAVLGSLLANYWFTPPYFTWTIADPEDVLALVVFVLVAVAVSSVVDLAARRATQAARSKQESETLSLLANSVLRGEDTAEAVLSQLRETFSLEEVALWERVEQSTTWRCVTSSGSRTSPGGDEAGLTLTLDPDRVVTVHGGVSREDERLLMAFATQAAVVLERQRLRDRAAETHRLEQGIAIRTALLAAVSHDLRTPLASIKAAVTSLRQVDIEWTPADEAELLATVEESADRLRRLIDNLLDLSRLQTGVVQPVLHPIGLDEVVPLALEEVPKDAVDVDVPESLPRVLADPGLLERVIANVVENSVTYASGPPIRVRAVARTASALVELQVIDHGPGVPAESRAAMFRPFQRLGDAPAGSGVGLGLAVARGLTEAMGGALSAEDTCGGGLTMVLSLPTGEVPLPTSGGSPLAPGVSPVGDARP